MEIFAALWWVFVLGFFLVAPLFLWLPLYLAFKVRGIERALWAVVSQLRAQRMEHSSDVDPAATRRALDVADRGGKVSLSMFGR
jgi:hypothetical protein